MTIDIALKHLSTPRLDIYCKSFSLSAESDQEKLIFIYLAIQDLTSCFYPFFQLTELALRNNIDTAMRGKFGDYWYKHLILNEETEQKFSNALSISKEKKTNPSHDDFVCEVTFGGWVNLLAPENRCGDVDLNSVQEGQKEQVKTIKNFWSDNINDIFPGRETKSIAEIFTTLKTTNNFRNRFSHYEPLWKPTYKQAQKVTSGQFLIKDKFEQALFFLNDKRQKTLAALKICSPHIHHKLMNDLKILDHFDHKTTLYLAEWKKLNKKK
jgi:hypothetical protein